MISNVTIVSMFVSILFSFLLFAGLILFYKKQTGIAVKPLVIGGIGFIVFTQVLEKVLHVIMLTNFPDLADNPWLIGLYGGFAAGIFEELGRFILYTWLLKKYLDYKGGISFGIGWGGTEAVLLMLLVMVPNIVFAFMINAGTLESALGAKMPADQLAAIKDNLLNQGVAYYLLSIVERFFAVFLQIALSLFVLLGVVKKKFSYVIYAILIHAAVDFPAAFYQSGHLSLFVVELYVAILGILSFVFIRNVKKFMP